MARSARAGLDAMFAAGACYTAFCALLYLEHHQPSFTGLPIPAEHYYLAQAVFVTPLLVLGWWIFSSTAHSVALRLGGEGQRAATQAALGYAYGVPLAIFYIIPDLIVFFTAGFDALAPAMRIYAPICLVAILGFSTLAQRVVHRLSMTRAFITVLPTFLLNAIVVGAFLR